MGLFRYAAALLAAMFAAVPSSGAQAAELLYEATGPGTTISFIIDDQLGPTSIEVDGFVVSNVFVQLNGVSQTRDIGFVRELSEGGFIILGTGYNLTGPQLFSGSYDAPTLLTGTFELAGFRNPELLYSLEVREVTSPVPEPSTWLLLIVGFGLLGMKLRVRASVARLAEGA